MFHYTIGIAGHIDHGKTTLTKALTGMNTDRLKEEQERNISIEVGFAHFTLPNNHTVGVVDVPGHERFIRQMISGVAGIDLVLLLVAGDEGMMPQTREHLEILHLLGIKKGIIVMTKSDLVDIDFLELVEEEIRETVQNTFLEYAPIIPISAKTGVGISELINEIEASLANIPGRGSDEPFRMPIDRVFSLRGTGTVVTGTIFEGKIGVGEDQLRLLPQDTLVRVRQLQVHHHKVNEAFAGQRTAVNITGVEQAEIKRGDILVKPNFLEPTQRIDIELEILASHDVTLKHRSKVNLYCGTAEVEGKLLFFGRQAGQPGEKLVAQLLLKEPVIVKRNDPFLLRRPTPALTLGGGKVINPYGEKYKFHVETESFLAEMSKATLEELILLRLKQRESTLGMLSRNLTIPWQEFQEIINTLLQKGMILIHGLEGSHLEEDLLIASPEQLETKKDQFLTLIHKYHQQNPTQVGMRRSECKERLIQWGPGLFEWVLEDLVVEGMINLIGERVAHSSFKPHLPPKLQQKADEFIKLLNDEGREVSDWIAIGEKIGLNDKETEQVYRFLISTDALVEMSSNWAWPSHLWEETVTLLQNKLTNAEVVIADVREALGLSRKYLIPILEKLDREGVTYRKGDRRYWRS